MCEGRKLTGTVLEECIRQNNPNPGQFLPHNISLAVPGAAVVFNPAQELIHTQREAKSQITFEKFGHRDDQEQMEKEDLCLTVVELHPVDSGFPISPVFNC